MFQKWSVEDICCIITYNEQQQREFLQVKHPCKRLDKYNKVHVKLVVSRCFFFLFNVINCAFLTAIKSFELVNPLLKICRSTSGYKMTGETCQSFRRTSKNFGTLVWVQKLQNYPKCCLQYCELTFFFRSGALWNLKPSQIAWFHNLDKHVYHEHASKHSNASFRKSNVTWTKLHLM